MQGLSEAFFSRAGFPSDSKKIHAYFTQRLENAYQKYFDCEQGNDYAKIVDGKWVLGIDPADTLPPKKEKQLKEMQVWLTKKMRVIKLPDLIIEVDNDIYFTEALTLPHVEGRPSVDSIFGVIAVLMAHGCNIGPYTMSKLIDGITYKEICRITDWQFTEDALRVALSWVVNAMSKLGVTQH
jgi:hypothetical protein